MVDLLLAGEPGIPCGALAEIAPLRVVHAAAAVGAGPVGARHGAQLAVVAIETVGAGAGVGVFQVLRRSQEHSGDEAFRWISGAEERKGEEGGCLRCSFPRCDRDSRRIR